MIERRLGAPVTASSTAGGGFTRAFAGVLETATGARAFVKAAPVQEPAAEAYEREASITSLLPPEVAAPRFRWALEAEGYFVVCLDAIDGHVPVMPWRAEELQAALDAWQTAITALHEPPKALRLPAVAHLVRDQLCWWSEIAAGRAPLPAAPAWVAGKLDELARLEQALPAMLAGHGMMHGDLRIDNVIIDGDGKAWLCDWAWPCIGQPWFDTVTLLVTAYASGHDVDRLVDAPAEGVDGVLAVMSGHWLVSAASGPSSASPHQRQHQAFSGRQALAWLAERRGWSAIDLGAAEPA
ncbi:phosphotransferase family protein [Actinoplanes sp. TFC3]|uniref:phosphotransferase family protein n=1 Tax=Actinoplanes sp. TFC3 TaxID=1710355 RepID=UPI001F170D7E|nr:phosphotransferase [Actinoplanes sp. TFC3]